jgi:membrane protease YdiL (CAAX protease family)
MYALVLLIVWSTHLNSIFIWVYFALGALFLYGGILCPVIHYYVEQRYRPDKELPGVLNYLFELRGLGSPKQFFHSLKDIPRKIAKYRKEGLATLGLVVYLYINVVLMYREHIAGSLGIAQEQVLTLSVFVLPIVMVFALVLLTIMNRWDTYRSGLQSSVWITLFGIVIIVGAHFFFRVFPDLPLLSGISAEEKWSRFSIVTFGAHFAGYLLWAWVQQFIFLSIFATSFSHAFDIETRKGMISAVFLSAFFFGVIHLPNIWLFAMTFVLGLFWSHLYTKTRNLFVIAISHGFLAALSYQLLPIFFSTGLNKVPEIIYFAVRAGTFFLLPFCFCLFTLIQGGSWRRLKIASLLLYTLSILFFYPDSGQGPDFYWGKGGNGKTWESNRQIIFKEDGEDYTEYLTTGDDGFLLSRPIQVLHP